MSWLETAARLTWHAWGDYAKHTFCDGCDQFVYCRQHRRRGRWLCLDCWDLSPESDLLPVRLSYGGRKSRLSVAETRR